MNKSNSGEDLDTIYITTLGVKVAIPKSEAMFYVTLRKLHSYGVIDDNCLILCETAFFVNGYDIVA